MFFPLRSGNFKIVLVLLIEIIIFYIQITIIKIGVPRLRRSINIISTFDRYYWDLVLDPFGTRLYKLLEKVFIWQSWQNW